MVGEGNAHHLHIADSTGSVTLSSRALILVGLGMSRRGVCRCVTGVLCEFRGHAGVVVLRWQGSDDGDFGQRITSKGAAFKNVTL